MPIHYDKNTKNTDVVECECDLCGKHKTQLLLTAKRNIAKNAGVYICLGCKCRATPKPQNTKEHWIDPDRKKRHSESIRSSDAYYEGIANRPSTKGELNNNWGKIASVETRAKMSKSRTGKIGPNATAWKGGRTSFTARIKTAIQRRYKWFHRVIDRDGCCVKCGAIKELDAHHINPVAVILKNIIGLLDCTNPETFNIAITHPLIVDKDLVNGVTLCRSCHKIEHLNWGSHEPKV